MDFEMQIVTNQPTFINPKLNRATKQLVSANVAVERSNYAIAGILAEIEVNDYYSQDGFSNCANYAMETFGIKKTTAYGLIAIGKDYTRPILDAKGRTIGYCSNLLPPANPDEQDAPLVDFTTRQIAILMPLGRETILDAIAKEEISPNTTCAKLAEYVKAHKSAKETEPDAEQESEPDAEQGTETEPRNPLKDFTDEQLIYEISARGYTVISPNYPPQPTLNDSMVNN